jgi:hypothetical protein
MVNHSGESLDGFAHDFRIRPPRGPRRLTHQGAMKLVWRGPFRTHRRSRDYRFWFGPWHSAARIGFPASLGGRDDVEKCRFCPFWEIAATIPKAKRFFLVWLRKPSSTSIAPYRSFPLPLFRTRRIAVASGPETGGKFILNVDRSGLAAMIGSRIAGGVGLGGSTGGFAACFEVARAAMRALIRGGTLGPSSSTTRNSPSVPRRVRTIWSLRGSWGHSSERKKLHAKPSNRA